LTSAIAAPLVPQEISRVPEPAPVETASVETAAVVEPEQVAPVASVPVQSELALPTSDLVAAVPMAEVEPAAEIATPTTPQAPSPAKAGLAPMQLNDLDEVLKSAGLTLAVTDPDKLRAAQEASSTIPVVPRVPRERKPLPSLPSEPLIQVETHR